MDKISIVEKISINSSLLSMPDVFSRLLEESSKENYSARKISDIILRDPSLTTKILKIANSSFYRRSSEVQTVQQAVNVLGVTTVKCLALSTSLFRPEYIEAETGLDVEDYFTYVLSVSIASEKIAVALNFKSREEALIAGLLHDIGIFYFLQHYPKEYALVLKRQLKGGSIIDAELEIFGIDHCDVGFRLAREWGLPDEIAGAIAEHHLLTHEKNKNFLIDIVRLAVLMTHNRFSEDVRPLEERVTSIRQLSESLGLNHDDVNAITRDLLTGVIGMAHTVGVEIGNTEKLMGRANQEIWKSYLTIEHLFKERQELTQKLLVQERQKGAADAKTKSLETLAHYMSNAVMVISGQFQILELLQKQGQSEKIAERIPVSADITSQSIKRIVAVMRVMRELSPDEQVEYFASSRAMNIDDRIDECVKKIENEPGVSRPEMDYG